MQPKNPISLKQFFDEKVLQYNQPGFIKDDPVCIPHLFTKKQDIEIAGLFAAVFAWGNRTTIINKSKELMQLMDMTPHDFCLHHSDKDLQKLTAFKHRTFNATDLLYFIEFLKYHYTNHKSLEEAFLPQKKNSPPSQRGAVQFTAGEMNGGGVEFALTHFHNYFFSLEHVPNRTRKHIATPYKGSTCKRLNMYLRWMVRKDKQGVDFGIWKKIKPSELICPIDLHVAHVAKRFGLLNRKQIDWQAAVELTTYLRTLDPVDPVKYDFALFGLGVMEKYR
ncbi:MAG: TIGR02757 family protein [Bacteroidota bacterium]